MEEKFNALTPGQQQKIKDLMDRYDIENCLDERLSFKANTFIVHGVTHIFAKFITKEQRSELLGLFPPTESSVMVYETRVESPFNLILKNPAKDNEIEPFCLQVSWASGGVHISFKVDVSEISEFVKASDRGIKDTELVHFPGISRAQINKIKLHAWTFVSTNVQRWFNGDVTLKNVYAIKAITDKLFNSEEKCPE